MSIFYKTGAVKQALMTLERVIRSGRSAKSAQVERKHNVAVGQRPGDARRRLKLNAVPLPVIDGQRDNLKARLSRHRRADHRVQPARQKYDSGPAHSRSPSRGAIQNIRA